MRKLAIMTITALALVSCNPRGGVRQPSSAVKDGPKPFPSAQIPGVYADDEGRRTYLLSHFWDRFFEEGGKTDSSLVLGVAKNEVEQAMANYVRILELSPMKDAQKSVSSLFDKIERKQAEDTTRLHYLQFTEIVSRYLYDPNSPMRSEDLYLPFVRGLARSRYTRDDMRPAYAFEASKCAVNQYGQKVPDIRFRTLSGKKETLYSVKADYTMLFFSNPGCHSCKEIIDDVRGRMYMDDYIARKKVAVVNVYIDEDVDEWRAYAPNYPSNWHSGYDFTFSIRDGEDYYIRAIPSLYLLDADKRVIMKDAPTERVLDFLDKI